MAEKVVVVGGGIAGIFSALLYNQKGYDVTLIEKENQLGGLLRSQNLYADNFFFDYGTHLLAETGIPEIDELLFDGLEKEKFEYLKTGSFYKGLYTGNGFISDKNVEGSELFLNELIETVLADHEEYSDLGDYFINRFGRGYAESVLKPAAEKFFGVSVDKLDVNGHKIFGLSRIIAGDEEQTRRLKSDPKFDEILAYHSYLEGLPDQKSMYPKARGVGDWINFLERKLHSKDVKVVTGVDIEKVNLVNNVVKSIQVSAGEIESDKLIWTIPPFLLLHLCGLSIPSSPPKRLTSCIFHYVIDQNYLTDIYYFSCFDPNYKSFRVTLYDNYMPILKNKKKVSVEVLVSEPPVDVKSLEREIFTELIDMEVISKDTNLLFSDHNIYPDGFPVLTKSFVENSKKQCEIAEKNMNNLKIFGKANGKTWFMNEIIRDIYERVG